MSDEPSKRNLWGKKGVAENIAGSLEPQPETVTGTPPVSDTEENPLDPREQSGIVFDGLRISYPDQGIEMPGALTPPGGAFDDLDRAQLAGEIYRDILGAYWPKLTDVGVDVFNVSSCTELFKACAIRATAAADALHEALSSE
jgi:hypothetical protein